MARALMGHIGGTVRTGHEQALALEVARLRRRVVELESEIEDLRRPAAETLDLELHQITGSAEPALA